MRRPPPPPPPPFSFAESDGATFEMREVRLSEALTREDLLHLERLIITACRQALSDDGIELQELSDWEIEENWHDAHQWSYDVRVGSDERGFAFHVGVPKPPNYGGCSPYACQSCFEAEARALVAYGAMRDGEDLSMEHQQFKNTVNFVIRNAAGRTVWSIDDVPRDTLAVIRALEASPRIG